MKKIIKPVLLFPVAVLAIVAAIPVLILVLAAVAYATACIAHAPFWLAGLGNEGLWTFLLIFGGGMGIGVLAQLVGLIWETDVDVKVRKGLGLKPTLKGK